MIIDGTLKWINGKYLFRNLIIVWFKIINTTYSYYINGYMEMDIEINILEQYKL